MESLGRARRVRIYASEDDRRAGKLLYRALVEFLRTENAQGATVIRAIEGFGAAGRLHSDAAVDIAAKLPVIVEWIDRPEQIERLMPHVLDLIKHGLVTVDDTDLLLFEPHPVPSSHTRVSSAPSRSSSSASVWRTPVCVRSPRSSMTST